MIFANNCARKKEFAEKNEKGLQMSKKNRIFVA